MRKEMSEEGTQDMEDFFAEMKAINEGPWLARVWYYRRTYLLAPWRKVREAYSSLIAFWQRGRRGWAISDTWYGDVYLARLISEMCAYLVEHHCGVPFPFSSMDEDLEQGDARYTAYLREIAQAFGEYVQYMDGSHEDFGFDVGNVRYTAILERMRPILDHWSCLND